MAFFRPAYLLKYVFRNVSNHSYCLVSHRVNYVNTAFIANIRQYAIHTKQNTLPLAHRLANMQQFACDSQFISKHEGNELLSAFATEGASSTQFLQSFKFFGKLMSDEMPEYRMKLISKLWELLEKNYPIEIDHFNALLAVRCENEELFSLEETLADLESRKLKANTDTFLIIMENYCRICNLDGALKTLETASDHGFELNAPFYNWKILAYGLSGHKEKAFELVKAMKSNGFEQTDVAFLAILRVHAKYGNIAFILSELNRWKSDKKPLDNKYILQLIYDLAVNGHGTTCKSLFHMIIKEKHFARVIANTINRLIRKNQDDVAYNLLKTISSDDLFSADNLIDGQFFLEQMIRVNRPIDQIIDMCHRFQNDDICSQPFQLILNQFEDVNDITKILEALQEGGEQMYENDFKSLFNGSSGKHVAQPLKIMIHNFGIHPSAKFLYDVVLPKMDIENLDETINILFATDVPRRSTTLAISMHCLKLNQLNHAARIITNFKFYIPPGIYETNLIAAFRRTKDIEGYVQFVAAQYWNLEKAPPDLDRHEIVGKLIYNTIIEIKMKHCLVIATHILKGLVDQGVTISADQAIRIENALHSIITDDISLYLEQLKSSELKCKPNKITHSKSSTSSPRIIETYNFNVVQDFYKKLNKDNAADIQAEYKQLSESNLNAVGKMIGNGNRALYYLFNALADVGDVKGVDKVNSILPEMEQHGIWYRDAKAKASAASGQVEQWIDDLNTKLQNAETHDELESLDTTFPVHGFYKLLEKNIKECEALAHKYAEKGVIRPISAIWAYHFSHENYVIAEDLWNKYIKRGSYIYYWPIITKALNENNVVIVNELIERLETSDSDGWNLTAANNALLEIYVRKGQLDDALKLVETLRNKSEKFNRKTLIQLRNDLHEHGRSFPYKVPSRGAKVYLASDY